MMLDSVTLFPHTHDYGVSRSSIANPAKNVDWLDLGRVRVAPPPPSSAPNADGGDNQQHATSAIELNTCMLEDLLATALEYDAHIVNKRNDDHRNGPQQRPQDERTSSQHEENGASAGNENTSVANDHLLGVPPTPQDYDDRNTNQISLSLSPTLRSQLRNYVTEISSRYHRVGFHSFDHASHVVLSATKFVYMLQRHSPFHKILTNGWGRRDERKSGFNHNTIEHDLTGTIYDPWLHFAVVFATLIHDVDHKGVPNNQLMAESDPIAAKYGGEECMKSYAEWNSVDIGLSLLRDRVEYTNLASVIGGHQKDRFYKMVTDLVLCTDIACKERRDMGMQKWEKTMGDRIMKSCSTSSTFNSVKYSDGIHGDNTQTSLTLSYTPEEVSCIAEQIIQAADVSHTMQHFSTFSKWNTHLYHEVLAAYNCGRTNNVASPEIRHPKENWYESQIGFFDFYVIPLAERLDACGVFSDEQKFAQLASRNKEQWIEIGRDCSSTMVMEAEMMELPPPLPVIAHVGTGKESSGDDSRGEINKLITREFESSASITEDTDAMSIQRSVESSSRVSRAEVTSHSSRSWKSKWGRRSTLSSFCSDVDSSVNAIVPHVCVKQLIDSFQSNICNLPPNLRKNALRGAMSEYQSTGFIQRHRGALLFVDISGFTELSQRFNVEDFKKFINDYFTKIIDLVNSFGGEAVKFAGDALIAIWISAEVPHEFNGDVSSDGMEQDDAVHALNIEKCTSCAIAINVECNNYKVSKTYKITRKVESAENSNTAVNNIQYDERMAILTVYCGVSEGIMAGVNVVANNRAEFFLVGKPLKDAATAEHLAGPGESVISPSVLRILKSKADTPIVCKIIFTSVDKDGGDDSFHKVSWSCPPSIEDILLYFDDRNASICKRDAESLINELVQTTQPDEVDKSLKLDLMRLFENHRHEAARDVVGRFTAELRRVAVLFISIKFEPTLSDNPSEDCIVLDKFQNIYSIISDSVSSRSGQIRQFIYDDKGTVFIASFGLRGSVMLHPSDTAIYAAKEAQNNLFETLEIQCSIGITLGNIFCGETGSLQRYEYSLLGPSVNLSARLMAQGGWGEINCDEEVKNHAGRKHTFSICGMYGLKGYDMPIPFFMPIEHEPEKRDFEQDDIVTYFMKKVEKMGLVRDITKKVEATKIHPRVILITGDHEKGKDAFISAIVKHPVIRDSSNILEGNRCFHDDPFYCFIPIITKVILSFEEARERIISLKKRRKISSTLASFLANDAFHPQPFPRGTKMVPDELEPYLCLVNDFVFKGFPLFASSPEAKQLKLNEIDVCVEVISAIIIGYIKLQEKPGLLAISELDMVDAYSKKLMRQIVCSDTNLVIIGGVNSFTTHYEDPTIEADSVEAVCRKSEIDIEVIHMELLDKQCNFDLFAWSLRRDFSEEDLDVIDYPDLPDIIFRICGGMPNATVRLAHTFCKQYRKDYQMTSGDKMLGFLCTFLEDTPTDFEELIWFRIDRMSPEEQMLLKIASIAGFDQYSFSQILLETVLLAISQSESEDMVENCDDPECLPKSVGGDVPNSVVTSNENKINYMFQGDYFEKMLDSLVAHSFLEEVNFEMSDLSSMDSVMYRFKNNHEQLVVNGLMLDDQKKRTHFEVAKYYSSSVSKGSLGRDTGDSWTENDSLLSSNYGVLNVIALHYDMADAPIPAMLYYFDSSFSLSSLGVRDKAHGHLQSAYMMLQKILRTASIQEIRIDNSVEQRRCTASQMIHIIAGEHLKENLRILSKLTKGHLRVAFDGDIHAFKSSLTMLIKFGQSVGTIEREGFQFASEIFTEAIILLLIVLEDDAFTNLNSSVGSFLGQPDIRVANENRPGHRSGHSPYDSLSSLDDPYTEDFFGIDDLTVCFPAFSGLLTFYRDCHIKVTLIQETFLANLFVAVTQEAKEMIHVIRAKCVLSHLFLKHGNYKMAVKECEGVKELYNHDKYSLELVKIYGLDWALICIATMASTYVFTGQFSAAHDNIAFLKVQMKKIDEFASSTKAMFKGIVASCYLLLHEFEDAADMAEGVKATKYGFYFKPLGTLQEELANRKLALYNRRVFDSAESECDLLSVLSSDDINGINHKRTMLHKSAENLCDQGIEAFQAALCVSEVWNFELLSSSSADKLMKQVQYCQAGLIYLKQTSIQTDVNNHKNILMCLYLRAELLFLHQRLRKALLDDFDVYVDDLLNISGTEMYSARQALNECKELCETHNYPFMQLLAGKRFVKLGLDASVGKDMIERAFRCIGDADHEIAKRILSRADAQQLFSDTQFGEKC